MKLTGRAFLRLSTLSHIVMCSLLVYAGGKPSQGTKHDKRLDKKGKGATTKKSAAATPKKIIPLKRRS